MTETIQEEGPTDWDMPIAWLLGGFLVAIVLLGGGLLAGLPETIYQLLAIATSAVGFFTAILVRRRRGAWWWAGIISSLLTFALLVATALPWIGATIWGGEPALR